MKQNTLSIIGIFALLFVIGFASASQNVGLSFSAVSVNPGNTAIGSFTLVSNNNSLTSVTLTPSNGVTLLPTTAFSISNLPYSGSYSLSIPSGQISGAYPSLSFAAAETFLDGSNTTETVTIPSNITVSSVSSFNMPSVSLNSAGAGTITLTNTGNTQIVVALSQSSGDFAVNFSSSPYIINSANQVTLPVGQSTAVTVQTTTNPSTLTFGSHSITLTGTANNVATQTATLSLTGGSFCIGGKIGGNLTIDSVDVTSDGSDDLTWMPLDEVHVKVEVLNNADTRNINTALVLGLYDSNGVNRAGDLIFLNGEDKKIDMGTINSGDSREKTFDFTIPTDLKSGTYTILVKAYDKGVGESNSCFDTVNTAYSQSASVELEDTVDKYIAFDNAQLSQATATCGDTMTLSFNVDNIGDEDQDRVNVNVYNSELGINLAQELTNGLNSGDSQAMTFTFTVPDTASNGNHQLQISADYEYDDSADNYRQTQSGIIQKVPISINGCVETVNQPTVNAQLSSSATVGKDLTVTISLKNNLNQTAPYLVSAQDYSSWADLVSLNPSLASLAKGETKTFTLTLTPTQQGQQTFNIETTYNGQTFDQPVTVTVKAAQVGFFESMSNQYGAVTTWLVTLIVALIVLIVIILLIKMIFAKPRRD